MIQLPDLEAAALPTDFQPVHQRGQLTMVGNSIMGLHSCSVHAP